MHRYTISDSILKVSVLYLIIPFIILITFWVKPYFAIPIVICILFCLFRVFFKESNIVYEEFLPKEYQKLIVIFAIIVIWVCLSGVGGVAYQTDDHMWRNAMFEMLVDKSWPVVSNLLINGEEVARGFSYYLGFWLPAAVIGKLFGIGAGYFFQIVWAIVGIGLFYLCICIIFQKVSVWPLIIFIFFSGMDIIGYYISGNNMSTLSQTTHLEWWSFFQYSSFTTQLFWVFNQSIPAWLVTVVLYLQKSNKHVVLLLAATMLNSTMPFVGLIPFCVYWIFSRKYTEKFGSKKYWKIWFKDTMTFENIVGGGLIGTISFLYLQKNIQSTGISLLDLSNGGWVVWLTFVFVEAGVLGCAIYFFQKKNVLFYIAMVCLFILPLINIYGDKNFCMRASIPSLIILYICVINSLSLARHQKMYKRLYIILFILLIGAVTPAHEFIRNITESQRCYLSHERNVKATSVDFDSVMKNDYESTDVSKNIFFRYLCK